MTQIRVRRGTTAQWTSANPVLAAGEPGYDTTTGNLVMGDGVTAWASLVPFARTVGSSAPTGSAGGDLGGTYPNPTVPGLSAKQAADGDLTTIAALDSATAGALVTDGSGWIRKTYAQLKTALSLVKADVGLGSVDNTADSAKPISTATQSALDAKQPLDADLSVIAALTSGTGVLAADGAGWIAKSYAGLKTSMSFVKADVGLGSVDNTADSAKPVSTAQQTALDGKQSLDSDLTTIAALTAGAGNVMASDGSGWISKTYAALKTSLSLTKTDVGLGNVDNTSDANKPVSTAQATADALAVPKSLYDANSILAATTDDTPAVLPVGASTLIGRIASGGIIAMTVAQAKTLLALVKGDVGLGNVDNTADVDKAISTAQQTALDGKQPLDADLTTIAGLTATTDNFMQAKGSAWASRTIVQVKTDLAVNNVDNTSDANKPVSTAQQAALDAKLGPIRAYSGDGSDGAVTLDGTTAYAGFASLSGSTYTLTRDVFASTLIVNNGVSLFTANFVVRSKTSVTTNTGGTIHNNGASGANATGATGGTAGAAQAVQTLIASMAGGAGNTGAGSAGGSTATASIGAAGGAGGAGATAAGAAGTVSAPSGNNSGWRTLAVLAVGCLIRPASNVIALGTGAGGGGGGGDNTNKGGGGGASGGLLVINTPTLVNNGAIQSRGGAGGVQVTGGINCGAGGGGGGGAVIVNTATAITGSGTIDANGGAAGATNGTGAAGNAGASGNTYLNVWN